MAIETGLSDHHKMVLTVLKSYCKKIEPIITAHRDYKPFDDHFFRRELIYYLDSGRLRVHASLRKKSLRGNNTPFINKILSKAFMLRSRSKNPTEANKTSCKKTVIEHFGRELDLYFLHIILVEDKKITSDKKKEVRECERSRERERARERERERARERESNIPYFLFCGAMFSVSLGLATLLYSDVPSALVNLPHCNKLEAARRFPDISCKFQKQPKEICLDIKLK